MHEFEKLFQELTRQHDHSVVFNDFLTYCVDQFRIDYKPLHFNPEAYNDEEYRNFYALFERLINGTNEMLNNPNHNV